MGSTTAGEVQLEPTDILKFPGGGETGSEQRARVRYSVSQVWLRDRPLDPCVLNWQIVVLLGQISDIPTPLSRLMFWLLHLQTHVSPKRASHLSEPSSLFNPTNPPPDSPLPVGPSPKLPPSFLGSASSPTQLLHLALSSPLWVPLDPHLTT